MRLIVYLFAHVTFEVTSATKLIVGFPEQLSVAVTELVLGAGTDDEQVTVIATGQVMLGGVTS